MRLLAVLTSVGAVLITNLACSEQSLHEIDTPPTQEEEVDPDVAPTVPPPPPVDDEPLEPIADAGPDRGWATDTVIILDGSGSYDPNQEGLSSYRWTVVDSPVPVTLSNADFSDPEFTTAVSGTYTFELTVENAAGLWDTTPAVVVLTVEEEPVLEPIGDAGPDQSPDAGQIVDLDGRASFDPQGLDPLTYNWQLIARPAGSVASLDDNEADRPAFLADVAGDYVVELVVTNSAGVSDSTADQVVVTAAPVIQPPVADAGLDVNASTQTSILLNGSNSYDPQGLDPLTYSWNLIVRPAGSTASLTGAGTVVSSLVPDVAGTYTVELNVGNTADLWDLTPDTVDIVVVTTVVEEPVADAGADFGVLPLETVTLDGTGSYDPNDLDPLVYQWTMTNAPLGSGAELSNASAASPSFFADLAGSYSFELTVMNTDGTWDTTPDAVIVEATPLDGFYVEVSWDNTNDLDLHILDGNAALWSAGDANFCNQNPNWGGSGAADDPSLDADAIYGFGPETTTIDAPQNGSYGIQVHYFGVSGAASCYGFSTCPASVATVRVYLGGQLAHTFTRTLDDAGQVWNVATIDWPLGTINEIDTLGTTTETDCD